MATKYLYRNFVCDTEAEAQEKLSEVKKRLDNNPTDWCSVKRIEVLGDMITVLAGALTDEEILNPSPTQTYTFLSLWTGENFFPLTSEELTEKVNEYRRAYAVSEGLAVIKSYEEGTWTEEDLEAVKPPEDGTVPDSHVETVYTDITPNEDMSGYI